MAEGAFYEIDTILKKTTKLYAAYLAISLSLTSLALNRKSWSFPVKVGLSLPLSLLATGTLTISHISLRYSKQDLVYLKIGLDPAYPEIRNGKFNRVKHDARD